MTELTWRPNKKQELFLSLPWTIKEGFYGGGAGSGKSDVLLMYGIVHKLHENPRFKQVFLRRTFSELKNEIVSRSRDIYPRFGATFNESDMIWTFPRLDQFGSGRKNAGAMIKLGHCEDENDVHQYDSMEISLFTPDEITSLTEWIYLYIAFERNRAPKNSGLPSITRGAGMPGNIGHTFTKKRFVDPCPEGGKRIVGRGGNQRIYIHATLADNKDHIDPSYKQSLEGRPEAEKRAKLYGDWNAYLGQVFDEFRDKRYPDEPENALHVISPFDIPAWWPRIVVGDWGFAAMTWVGFAAISPHKRLYVYRELYWTKTKIEDWAPYVKEFVDKENPRLIRFCKSAGQERGQEHTIQEQISVALGRPVELSDNSPGSRISGKMLIHEYLRWKQKREIPTTEKPIYSEELAMRIYRLKGQEEYERYLSLFNPPEPETHIPKVQIFDNCPVLVNAIKACSYDKKRIEDIAEFEGDDPIDGFRYLVDAAESYFAVAQDEFKKVQKQEELIARLNSTQDWTAFYRNMRRVENEGSVKPVSRYHH